MAQDHQALGAHAYHEVTGLVDALGQVVHHGSGRQREALGRRPAVRELEDVVRDRVARGLRVLLQPPAALHDDDDAEQLAHAAFELLRDLGHREAALRVGEQLDDVDSLLQGRSGVGASAGHATGDYLQATAESTYPSAP
jgi:hypothetical protein